MTHQLLIESQCLPPVPVIYEMAQYDEVSIEVHENYQKRSFRNRIYLVGPQGRLHFTIPLAKGKHEGQGIREVQIAYDENWIDQFARLLRSSYSSAPFYLYYLDALMAIFSQEFQSLLDLNNALMNWIQEVTELSLTIGESPSYIRTEELNTSIIDLRNRFLPAQIESQAPIIKYRQVYEAKHGFIPNLSILDMIMCCGPEILQYFSSNRNEL